MSSRGVAFDHSAGKRYHNTLSQLLMVRENVVGSDLRVSADGHHLEKIDGTPFFYLADTAWELVHVLTLEQAQMYLRDRAAKGFTVSTPFCSVR